MPGKSSAWTRHPATTGCTHGGGGEAPLRVGGVPLTWLRSEWAAGQSRAGRYLGAGQVPGLGGGHSGRLAQGPGLGCFICLCVRGRVPPKDLPAGAPGAPSQPQATADPVSVTGRALCPLCAVWRVGWSQHLCFVYPGLTAMWSVPIGPTACSSGRWDLPDAEVAAGGLAPSPLTPPALSPCSGPAWFSPHFIWTHVLPQCPAVRGCL